MEPFTTSSNFVQMLAFGEAGQAIEDPSSAGGQRFKAVRRQAYHEYDFMLNGVRDGVGGFSKRYRQFLLQGAHGDYNA